jgi:predicted membrane channel-forming protein YqfA (hemolysin III family)
VWLAVFGYREVFHLLVIAGAAAHVLAISRFAVPTRVTVHAELEVGDG